MQRITDEFDIHVKLQEDCECLGNLDLCTVLLMKDARFLWLILVPRLSGLRDLHEIPHESRLQLFDEIDTASRTVQKISDAHKINVAALGNQVPQLHVHVIARRTNDDAWPGPVWGVGEPEPYEDEKLKLLCNQLQSALNVR